MGPDLHLDPDVVARLAATTRRIADGLAAVPAPRRSGAVVDPVRSVHAAADELLAFVVAAEVTVRRTRDADLSIARDLRTVHESIAPGLRSDAGPIAHELRGSDARPRF